MSTDQEIKQYNAEQRLLRSQTMKDFAAELEAKLIADQAAIQKSVKATWERLRRSAGGTTL